MDTLHPPETPENPPASQNGRRTSRRSDAGKIGWILLWLLGVPLPVLLIFFLLRGCT
ncbi:hypothetical protein OPIT5_12180 [Opitutaceae bacterium TAV5]|nr:hypothetical protein OPIT5_12180 [Opitutaceae bacterium TAV5]